MEGTRPVTYLCLSLRMHDLCYLWAHASSRMSRCLVSLPDVSVPPSLGQSFLVRGRLDNVDFSRVCMHLRALRYSVSFHWERGERLHWEANI